MVRNLTVHEAMPGHFLQLAHSRRYRGSTRVRALGLSGPFTEGWAVYAEEVMADHGFGGVPVRLQQLKMQLRMTINAILDQLVHCEGMTEADAMALMTGRGFQEEGEAAGKWRRALLTSTQLSTYFVGYSEVAEIGRARPAGTAVGARHDAMLAHGAPPPPHAPDSAIHVDRRGARRRNDGPFRDTERQCRARLRGAEPRRQRQQRRPSDLGSGRHQLSAARGGAVRRRSGCDGERAERPQYQ